MPTPTNNNRKRNNVTVKQEINLKSKAIKRHHHDSDEEEEASNDGDEQTGRAGSSQPIDYSPMLMHHFLQSIAKEQTENGKSILEGKRGNAKFDQLLQGRAKLTAGIDFNTVQTAFKHMLAKATHPTEISLSKAVEIVTEYVQGDSILHKHKDFPKRPANAYKFYLRQKGLTPFQSHQAVSQEFAAKKDPKAVAEAEAQFVEDKNRYLEQLKKFLATHQDNLFQSQIQYMEKTIRREEKKKNQTNGTPKKRQQITKPVVHTAFDFYAISKSDSEKYKNLDEEAKQAKLRRHWEKLPEEKKIGFEELARNWAKKMPGASSSGAH